MPQRVAAVTANLAVVSDRLVCFPFEMLGFFETPSSVIDQALSNSLVGNASRQPETTFGLSSKSFTLSHARITPPATLHAPI